MRYSYRSGIQKIQTKFVQLSLVFLLSVVGLSGISPLFTTHNVSAISPSITITGNTSSGENDPGWMFNRDPVNTTPYEFTAQKHSTGIGSIYVKPISTNASDKFIAEDFGQIPVSDLNSISYDYLIAGNGTAASANQFYLSVYANIDSSNNFYDCRFDYVPTTGSISSFSTASFNPTSTPVHVQHRGTRITTCPTTLAAMPAGSSVRMFSVNVGDTNASDAGLAGYLDNVVVNRISGTNAYDFEPAPSVTGQDFGVGFWTVASNSFAGINVGFRTDNFTHVDAIKVTLKKNGNNIVSNTASAALLNDINTNPGGMFDQNGEISTSFVTDGTLNDDYCGGSPCWNTGSHIWLGSEKPDTATITVTQNGVDYPATLSNFSEASGTFDGIIPQDTDTPIVSFTSPADGKVFSGTPSFELTASDDVAIRNVTSILYDSANNMVGWKVLAGNLDEPTFTTSGPVTYDTSGTPLPDGDYKMVANVQDMYGKYGTQDVLHVHIDHTAPSVTFTQPGTVSHNLKISVDMDGTGSNLVQYGFDVSGPGGLNFSTFSEATNLPTVTLTDYDLCAHGRYYTCPSPLPDGTYTVRAKAYDAGGNRNISTTRVFTVDNTGPAVTINTPSNDIVTNDDSVAVNVTVTDNHALNTLSVYLTDAAGNYINSCTSASNLDAYPDWVTSYTVSCNLDTSSLLDGTYNLIAKSQDRAGNSSNTATRIITVDNTKPTVTFVSPTDFTQPFSVGPDVTVSASDSSSGLNVFVIHVFKASDNSAAQFCTATASELTAGNMHCDLSGLTDGTYYIKAGATDKAGNNQTINSGNFTIDSTAPTATIDAYSGTDTTPTLTGTVSEPTATLTLAIDGGTPATVTNNGGTWSFTVPTALSTDSHTVTLVASDTAGNSYQTTANVTVVAPRASLTGLTASDGNGNSNQATGHQPTVTVTPNNDGQVLGANTEDTGKVKGDSTTQPTVHFANDGATQKDAVSKSGNFLGLGWWWLPVIVVVLGLLWVLLGRSTNRTDKTA